AEDGGEREGGRGGEREERADGDHLYEFDGAYATTSGRRLLHLADPLHGLGELLRVAVPEGLELRRVQVLDRRLQFRERRLEHGIGDRRARRLAQLRDHRLRRPRGGEEAGPLRELRVV